MEEKKWKEERGKEKEFRVKEGRELSSPLWIRGLAWAI